MGIRTKHLRIVGAALAALVIFPVGGQFFVSLAEERGFYKNPGAKVALIAGWLEWIVANSWFHWIGGAALGFALGVWLDSFVRRREILNPALSAGVRPLSETAPRFSEHLGHPIENEWWASLYRIANEARVQNASTPYGLSLRELALPDQTVAYAAKINEHVQLYGTPPGPQLCEPIMARGPHIRFHINGMQMDSVDSQGRGYYRYIHLRTAQVTEALNAVHRMAVTFSPEVVLTPSRAPTINREPAFSVTTQREFTEKTPDELLALFEGRTALQAEPLIEPYFGLWITAVGAVVMTLPGGGDAVALIRTEGGRMVECRFPKSLELALRRFDVGSTMKALGRVSPSQNGRQLYLSNCELQPSKRSEH